MAWDGRAMLATTSGGTGALPRCGEPRERAWCPGRGVRACGVARWCSRCVCDPLLVGVADAAALSLGGTGSQGRGPVY